MIPEDEFPPQLRERLWHTTTPDRYESILRSGSILPNPEIPKSDRWKTSRGPHYYPFVRTLGGVSLFDFDGFDPEAYSAKYPRSSWREFVPCRPEFEAAIWIEIDRAKIGAGFISGEELLAKWNHENKQRHAIMPLIEAAHIGPIPLSSTTRTITLPKRKVEHDPIAERLRAARDSLVLRGFQERLGRGESLSSDEEKRSEEIRANLRRLGISE